jgi:hypothetical protein
MPASSTAQPPPNDAARAAVRKWERRIVISLRAPDSICGRGRGMQIDFVSHVNHGGAVVQRRARLVVQDLTEVLTNNEKKGAEVK